MCCLKTLNLNYPAAVLSSWFLLESKRKILWAQPWVFAQTVEAGASFQPVKERWQGARDKRHKNRASGFLAGLVTSNIMRGWKERNLMYRKFNVCIISPLYSQRGDKGTAVPMFCHSCPRLRHSRVNSSRNPVFWHRRKKSLDTRFRGYDRLFWNQIQKYIFRRKMW